MAFGPVSVGSAPYTLPAATQNTLGGIKVGSNLSVNKGVLSAPAPYTLTADKIKTALGFTPASAAAAATVPYSITYEGCHVGTGGYTYESSPTVLPLSKSYDALGIIVVTNAGSNQFSGDVLVRLLLELLTHENLAFADYFIPMRNLPTSWTTIDNIKSGTMVYDGKWDNITFVNFRKNGNNFEVYAGTANVGWGLNTSNTAYHYFGINATGLWTV